MASIVRWRKPDSARDALHYNDVGSARLRTKSQCAAVDLKNSAVQRSVRQATAWLQARS